MIEGLANTFSELHLHYEFIYVGGRGKNVDYLPDLMLNEKVSLWKGDITRLEVDAIVNSSAADLQHHSATHAVCYAVHAAAGPLLHNECSRLHLGTGNALVTRGYNLPAKCKTSINIVISAKAIFVNSATFVLIFILDIIHAAGPINGDEAMLQSCYTNCFQLILEHGFRSVVGVVIAGFHPEILGWGGRGRGTFMYSTPIKR